MFIATNGFCGALNLLFFLMLCGGVAGIQPPPRPDRF